MATFLVIVLLVVAVTGMVPATIVAIILVMIVVVPVMIETATLVVETETAVQVIAKEAVASSVVRKVTSLVIALKAEIADLLADMIALPMIVPLVTVPAISAVYLDISPVIALKKAVLALDTLGSNLVTLAVAMGTCLVIALMAPSATTAGNLVTFLVIAVRKPNLEGLATLAAKLDIVN